METHSDIVLSANENEGTVVTSSTRRVLRAIGVLIAGVVAWAYWPILTEFEAVWRREPDYSHGYLVVLAVIYFLWSRRETRPVTLSGPAWGGLSLLLIAGGMRFLSAQFFISTLDGWSLPVAICGLVWLLMGTDWLNWSWSAIAFLVFMVPLPWRAETLLSLPLQRAATAASCWSLQCLGLPAVQQGNTILIGSLQLEVEQACSGLRMMTGVFALVFAYMILQKIEWWQRSLILVGAIPIALASNCVRIVLTALLFRWIPGTIAQRLSHDFAGFVIIPMAAGLLWAYVRFVNALVVELEPVVMPRPRS